MTRLRVLPYTLIIYGTDTRYLFLLIRFKFLLSSLPPCRLAENGCKSTTFFQTGKIFFHFPPKVFCNTLVYNMHCCEKIFKAWGVPGGKTGCAGRISTVFGGGNGENSGFYVFTHSSYCLSASCMIKSILKDDFQIPSLRVGGKGLVSPGER